MRAPEAGETGMTAGRGDIGLETARGLGQGHLVVARHEEGSIPESVKAGHLRGGTIVTVINDHHAGKMIAQDTMVASIGVVDNSSQKWTTRRQRKSVPRSWLPCKRLLPTWTKLARSGSKRLQKQSGQREKPMTRRVSRTRSIVEVMLGS